MRSYPKLDEALALGIGGQHDLVNLPKLTIGGTIIMGNCGGGVPTRSLTKRWPSALVDSMTWSTMPDSLFRRLVETSFLVKRCATPGCSSASGDVYMPHTPSATCRTFCGNSDANAPAPAYS